MKRQHQFKVVPRTPKIDRSPHTPKVSPFVDDPIPPGKAGLFQKVMAFHFQSAPRPERK